MSVYQLCIYLPLSKVQYLVATSFRGMAPNIFASLFCFALLWRPQHRQQQQKLQAKTTTCMPHIFGYGLVVAAALLWTLEPRKAGQSRQDRLELFSLPRRICFVYVFWFGCFYVLIMRLIRFFEADNGRKVACPSSRWQRPRRLSSSGAKGDGGKPALLRF